MTDRIGKCCECGCAIDMGNVCTNCMLDANDPRVLVAPSLLRPAVVPPVGPCPMTPELRRTLDFLKEPPTRGTKL